MLVLRALLQLPTAYHRWDLGNGDTFLHPHRRLELNHASSFIPVTNQPFLVRVWLQLAEKSGWQ